MINPLKKIIAVFILIALLPVSFIVYELSSLNKNEEIVRGIYQNQLDAILYSVNQHSDDIISSWASRINRTLDLQRERSVLKDSVAQTETRVLSELSSVRYIYFTDLEGHDVIFGGTEDDVSNNSVRKMLGIVVKTNRDKIDRLMSYKEAGFRKMDAIDPMFTDNRVPVFFVLDQNPLQYKLAAMVIDQPTLIQNVLGPKMQVISQDKFIISAFQSGTDSLIYSTGSLNAGPNENGAENIRVIKNEWQKKEFWLLPGYYLAISLKGATIDDLVKDRVTTSLVILVLLMLLLITGLLFLYRNIRREINLSQAKSEFVSNVSHEIRTPLSLISMYAETLELNRITEEKKKEYYGVISKETARLSGIVNRILDFSRITSNKKMYDFRPVQLNDLAGEIIESYSFHLKDKGFTWNLSKDDSIETIMGDREAIGEAIINLLDNAIKYSREQKCISMKTGKDKRYSFVEVRDHGIGIAKNHQAEIFEQFYRAPIGDVHTTKGSGLGLALVKRIVEAHHGKIKVESTLGEGSTFRLYFPTKNAYSV
jgi:two-component system phosphate regulon sensor histidine kinase PhoR